MDDPNETGPGGQTASAPLTPEALAMLGKARRSFGISIGILLLGFMAIGVALVYRAMRDAPPPVLADTILAPSGAEIISALSSDGTVQLTYRQAGKTMLSIYDATTGQLRNTLTITLP
ncbi:MAG: hypothetical protein KKF33_12960 [Alphaproteobacteria bacterium]|nr:hypothetical protein [Alphaproteobacteria bacterium]